MKDLIGYSDFLLKHKLEELSRENLSLLKKYDVPLMKFFAHLPEEELYNLSKTSVEKFVKSLEDGTARENARIGLKQWEDDQMPGIRKGDIHPSDLVLIYTIQKQGLLKFLPEYSQDIEVVLNIIRQLEDYFVEVQNDAILMLFKIQQEASEGLRQSEERYHILVNEVVDYAIIRLDAEGNVITWNKGAERIKGYKAEEIIGKNISVFYTPEELMENEPTRNLKFAELHKRHEKEGYRVRKDGTLFWAHIIYTALFDEAGQLTGFVKVTRDISDRKLSDEKIAKTLQQLSQAQAMAHIGSWEWDMATNSLFWSDELYRIYEYDIEKPVYPFEPRKWIVPEDAEMVKNIMEDVIAKKKSFNFNFRIHTKNNNFKILHAQGTTEVNQENELVKMSGTLQDITERKLADQKINKTIKQLSQAQQMAHIGSWEWDMKPNLISWSDELYRIYGLEPQEFEATYEAYLSYIHPDDKEMVNDIILRATGDKKPFQFDHRIINKKGEEKILNSHGIISLDKDGNAVMMSGTAQDITERIQVREELKRAEDTVRAKQQFLSNMSHEIRTPMNAIIGFTKVVLKTDLSMKQKEYLDAIKISGETLLVLINDILDLAKVDEGKMVFENIPFKIASSFTAMIHLFETRMQEKNLNLGKLFDPNIPPVLMGDPVRLHQIILNLMSNAVKFTKKGHIIVAVRLFREDESTATIEFAITDSGIGIAPERMDDIFENFHQASSSTARLYGGTGLGLAIVKQLVEKQGGSIKVKSQLDKGSTFTFFLTFNKPSKEAEMQVVEESQLDLEKGSDLKDIRILVVEDIPLNQLLMKTLLSDFGSEFEIAENGKIAIEKMKASHFDLVLMDLQMPVMNGFEATELIRNTLSSLVPIIALTADVTTVDLEKCKAVGMNDYIAKPINERILFNKIINVLKKSNARVGVSKTRIEPQQKSGNKISNLDYIIARTKKNPLLMREMIRLYLEQTPVLVNNLKEGALATDWDTIRSSAHKLIPSFSIVGISNEYERMAKTIQDYAGNQDNIESIREMALKIEQVCMKACAELAHELKNMETKKES